MRVSTVCQQPDANQFAVNCPSSMEQDVSQWSWQTPNRAMGNSSGFLVLVASDQDRTTRVLFWYSAAELKHGPLALISPVTPTVVVIPRDDLHRKNISTIEEIHARRGPVFAVTHAGDMPAAVDGSFEVPASEPELAPMLLNIPLQLLAYHVALKKGCDIDKPRNLAKSVTVE